MLKIITTAFRQTGCWLLLMGIYIILETFIMVLRQ